MLKARRNFLTGILGAIVLPFVPVAKKVKSPWTMPKLVLVPKPIRPTITVPQFEGITREMVSKVLGHDKWKTTIWKPRTTFEGQTLWEMTNIDGLEI